MFTLQIWKNWQVNILKLLLYYPTLFTVFCILMLLSAGRIFALLVWSSSFEHMLCVWTCEYIGGLYFMNFLEDPQLGLGQYALHKQQLQAREIWVGNFEKYTLQMQKLSLKAKFVGMEISWNIAIHIPATGENLLYLSFFCGFQEFPLIPTLLRNMHKKFESLSKGIQTSNIKNVQITSRKLFT